MIKIHPLSSVITANMSTSSTGIFKGQEMGLRGGGAGPGAAANHGRASIQRSEVQVSQAGVRGLEKGARRREICHRVQSVPDRRAAVGPPPKEG